MTIFPVINNIMSNWNSCITQSQFMCILKWRLLNWQCQYAIRFIFRAFIHNIFVFQLLFQPIQGAGLLFSSEIIFRDGRTSWTSDQPVARSLPKHRTTQTQNKHIHKHQTSIPCVGFEVTIPVSEWVKTVHDLDRDTIVTGAFIH
jgi:hypothetical protein